MRKLPFWPNTLAAIAALASTLPGGARAEAVRWTERPDWAPFFERAGVPGTIVVVDERTGEHLVHDAKRAAERLTPASTFKVPHLLFALDARIVRDEFQVLPWDRVERSIPEWNRDQTIRSSMRHSVVWVYQDFARKLGERRERAYLRRIGYGNADPSGSLERFWLDGRLRVSAFEQVAFLRRLHRNALPFRVEHQRLVKDVMVVEAGKDFILRAKTGWALRVASPVGWWVGWVEHPEGAVFFAINIGLPRGGDDVPRRVEIARAILGSLKALPQ